MKGLLLFFAISAAFSCGLFASDSLPFPVGLGGQAAKDGTPFAKIANPVAADAELSVDSKSDMIIVNVNMVNAKNEPFFFQAEDGIRDHCVTGVQTCALPICQSRR